ncbi:hypothetical protein Q5O24_12270 [Eubacteriaceae bacterium ES3]|nr:hypothetical protein Q5O24_12270 [Eubacteriaceae bacterium ES3]
MYHTLIMEGRQFYYKITPNQVNKLKSIMFNHASYYQFIIFCIRHFSSIHKLTVRKVESEMYDNTYYVIDDFWVNKTIHMEEFRFPTLSQEDMMYTLERQGEYEKEYQESGGE